MIEAISFCALILTVLNGVGEFTVPDIAPVDEERERPDGREPDITENERESPVTVGVNERFELVVNT